MIMEVCTIHLDLNLINKKKNQNNTDSKLNVFDYLKSLSQEAKVLVDEIEDADKYIDIKNLPFIGSNQEKFNLNTFRTPFNFLSDIYNAQIILKEAEISQKNLDKKIEKLRFNYKPNNVEEKEEIDGELMHVNDLLEYRDKIIEAFKDGTFSSKRLKKLDDAVYGYVLESVKKFIQKIKSMAENINLSLFEEFFKSLSPADYAKKLINVKDTNENKETVTEIKDKISYLKDRIKEMSEKEKKYSELLKRFLITIKGLKKLFLLHQNLIKENQNQNLKKVLQKQ